MEFLQSARGFLKLYEFSTKERCCYITQLKTEAFAIPALRWYRAGSTSYSSLAHSQLASGGAGDKNSFCELAAGSDLRPCLNKAVS